jgi:hypothetical protein
VYCKAELNAQGALESSTCEEHGAPFWCTVLRPVPEPDSEGDVDGELDIVDLGPDLDTQ